MAVLEGSLYGIILMLLGVLWLLGAGGEVGLPAQGWETPGDLGIELEENGDLESTVS